MDDVLVMFAATVIGLFIGTLLGSAIATAIIFLKGC